MNGQAQRGWDSALAQVKPRFRPERGRGDYSSCPPAGAEAVSVPGAEGVSGRETPSAVLIVSSPGHLPSPAAWAALSPHPPVPSTSLGERGKAVKRPKSPAAWLRVCVCGCVWGGDTRLPGPPTSPGPGRDFPAGIGLGPVLTPRRWQLAKPFPGLGEAPPARWSSAAGLPGGARGGGSPIRLLRSAPACCAHQGPGVGCGLEPPAPCAHRAALLCLRGEAAPTPRSLPAGAALVNAPASPRAGSGLACGEPDQLGGRPGSLGGAGE